MQRALSARYQTGCHDGNTNYSTDSYAGGGSELGRDDKDYPHRYSTGIKPGIGLGNRSHPVRVAAPASSAIRRLSEKSASSPFSVPNTHSLGCVSTSGNSGIRLHSSTSTSAHLPCGKSVVMKSSLHSSAYLSIALHETPPQLQLSQQRPMGRYSSALCHMASACTLDVSLSPISSTLDVSRKSSVSSLVEGGSVPAVSCARLDQPDLTQGMGCLHQQTAGNRRSSTTGGGEASPSTLELPRKSNDRSVAHAGGEHGSREIYYKQPPFFGAYPSGHGFGVMPTDLESDAYLYSGVKDTAHTFWASPDSTMRNAQPLPPAAMGDSSLNSNIISGDGDSETSNSMCQLMCRPSVSTSTKQRILTRYASDSNKPHRVQHSPVTTFLAAGDVSSSYDKTKSGTDAPISEAPPTPTSLAMRSAFMEALNFRAADPSPYGDGMQATAMTEGLEPESRPLRDVQEAQRAASNSPQPKWLRPVDRGHPLSSLEPVSSMAALVLQRRNRSPPLTRAETDAPLRGSPHAVEILNKSPLQVSTSGFSFSRIGSECTQPSRVTLKGLPCDHEDDPLGNGRGISTVFPRRAFQSSSSSSASEGSATERRLRARRSVTPSCRTVRNRLSNARRKKKNSHESGSDCIAKRRGFHIKPLSVAILSRAARQSR